MGWCGGSFLFREIIRGAIRAIPAQSERTEFYVPIYKAFRYRDWDTVDECIDMDPAFVDAIVAAEPDYFECEGDYRAAYKRADKARFKREAQAKKAGR